MPTRSRTRSCPRWEPRYTLTPAVTRALLEIEAARAVVAHTPLPPAVEADLRRQARLRSTHFSTRIEGNRLSLDQARQAVERKAVRFHGRERDVREVRNYWSALLRVEEWAASGRALSEDLVRRLHALVEKGPRAKPTPYRDGQNAIRDAGSGGLVYLPPEAKDVPGLMSALVAWERSAEKEGLAVPLLAGLVHYQFVTIHPYYDGNGRTARLLATFLLHRGGYGLNGFLSLEEYHARDLEGYYGALSAHPHPNYYEGRSEADLTPWLEYFVRTLAGVFSAVQTQALERAGKGKAAAPEGLRRLDPRARAVLALFAGAEEVTGPQVASALGLSERSARLLLAGWAKEGWLLVSDPSNRRRRYALSARYRQVIGNPGG